ncbi:MAG: hypothetical protein BWX70_02529 [Verrucomicrobia bacterium ADurb.Bin070]|nr:MAG: hypothetical protein BWX70_02529 [Verrucomicrobia bacterium ADurb.Bin070]
MPFETTVIGASTVVAASASKQILTPRACAASPPKQQAIIKICNLFIRGIIRFPPLNGNRKGYRSLNQVSAERLVTAFLPEADFSI